MTADLLETAPRTDPQSSCDLPWTDILGVRIDAIDMPAAIATIEDWIERDERQYACLCTVHGIMEADKDPAFKRVLNSAGLRCPDGMPLVWLSRRSGKPWVNRVYGPDLMLELCARSQHTGHRHFFYGGSDGVTERLVDNLTQRFPQLHVAGMHTPRHLALGEIDHPDVIARINETNPDLVWVGLGCPKQEWWLANHRHLLHAPALLGVGAAFDFHSGAVRQAPRWMQRNGLEWVYRLSQDPRRLAKRYGLTNAAFIMRILGARLVNPG